jgi:hypothetical protein
MIPVLLKIKDLAATRGEIAFSPFGRPAKTAEIRLVLILFLTNPDGDVTLDEPRCIRLCALSLV